MKRIISFITASVFISAVLSSCNETPAEEYAPLMGLEWFMTYDAVKDELSTEKLAAERESNENTPQKMQDYSDIQLYDISCDLTLCFTDSGLIGFNYHDNDRNNNYRKWFSMIENDYGLPDEQGNGMASWYNDPVGRDTAIYLFNLQEGVQISYYATADSPDRTYKKSRERKLPSPELLSPIVSFEETEKATAAETTSAAVSEVMTTKAAEIREEKAYNDNAHTEEDNVQLSEVTTVSETSSMTITTTVSSAEITAVTTTKPDRTGYYIPEGIGFYSSPDAVKSRMSAYSKIADYRNNQAGQPWEYIIEYSNVPYLDIGCDTVFCFTSLGLVGISYFDSNSRNYDGWMAELTDIYGEPDEPQYNYAAWNDLPSGAGSTIYLFAADNGVQISFFADDSGSEMSE